MKKDKIRIKISDLSTELNEVQQLKILSDREAIGISGGAGSYEPTPSRRGSSRGRGGPSNGCGHYP